MGSPITFSSQKGDPGALVVPGTYVTRDPGTHVTKLLCRIVAINTFSLIEKKLLRGTATPDAEQFPYFSKTFETHG